jgi:hypothetical protein
MLRRIPTVIHNRMPAGPDKLDSLARQAKDYALHMMRTAGSMPPTVIADTAEGYVFCVPGVFTDDAAKDRFADVARLLAVAHNASALVLIAEAWASLPDARGHIDTETPPSQSANRKEIIALMLEDGNRQGSMLIPIVRGWNEVFVGFGDTAPVAYGQSEGRFSGMMPPRKPGPDDRAKAAALLQALGLNIVNRGFDPKLN